MSQPNPMRGWSREAVSREISHLVRERGYPPQRAVAAALAMARQSYRRVHPRGGYPKHLSAYKANRMEALTFGVLPKKEKFLEALRWEIGDGLYKVHLRGRDAHAVSGTALEEAIDRDGFFDGDDLYDALKQLVRRSESSHRHAATAGELASAILSTLGFEWV